MFNPEWENLPNFKRFLESKDPNERYEYSNVRECACAQYLKSRGRYFDRWLRDRGLNNIDRLAAGRRQDPVSLDPSEWTFGKLLARTNAKIKELEAKPEELV